MKTRLSWLCLCVFLAGCPSTREAAKSDDDLDRLVKASDRNAGKKLDFLADERMPNEEYVVTDTGSGDTSATVVEYKEVVPTKGAKYRVQVFSGSPLNASRNLARLDSVHPGEVYMVRDSKSDHWKVWVGNYMIREEAERARDQMVQLGYPDAWINEMQPPYSSEVKAQVPLFWVQIGSYSVESSALKIKTEVESRQPDRVEVRMKDGAWKVWVGGYPERGPADELKQKLAGLGYSGFVVKSEE